MDKLLFLIFIFAVLLSKWCIVSLCNYVIYLSGFSIPKTAAIGHIRLPKIKTLTLPVRQVLETDVHHRPKFHQNRSNACSRHVAI